MQGNFIIYKDILATFSLLFSVLFLVQLLGREKLPTCIPKNQVSPMSFKNVLLGVCHV